MTDLGDRMIHGHTFIVVLCISLIACTAYSRDFFVSPDGDDHNDGALGTPFQTVSKALEKVQAGDAIRLRGGVYACRATLRIDVSGQADNPLSLRATPGEVPVLDFQNSGSSSPGIRLGGSFWHITGLVIQHAGDNGVIVYGSSNRLEHIVARYNGDSGIQLHTGAAHNRIENCDSYLNYDPQNHGENADGFAAKFGLGEGNAFVGCRSWGNSDDGYDLWEAGLGVTLVNCWAFRNGVNVWRDTAFSGDGNGFKLGHGSGAHVLMGCVAYDHPHNGIDVNGNVTGVTLHNCTCVGNRGPNFFFDEHSKSHVLRNNLSYQGSVVVYSEIDDANNSWNGLTVKAADFRSLDPNGIDGPRTTDGSLPRLPFLRPGPASSLIDAGVDVGLPYEGRAPDLGAFEFIEEDRNGDGAVDAIDLAWLASHWLDADAGGVVNFVDFSNLAAHWRQ
jgi:hypothetical protein